MKLVLNTVLYGIQKLLQMRALSRACEFLCRQFIQKHINLPKTTQAHVAYLILTGIRPTGTRASILRRLGHYMSTIGEQELSADFLNRSLKFQKTPEVFSGYLATLLASSNCDDERMFNEAIRYNRLFIEKVNPYPHLRSATASGKRLKIGYVCHFFHNSISRSQLLPFLRNHDRQAVEVFCYSDGLANAIGNDVRICADVWRDTAHLSHKELAQLIRADEIDILLEINGHCAINRYQAFAYRPAPVQVSFYNISATSGVCTIDYILVGDQISLESKKQFYVEKPHYLPGPGGIATFPESFPVPSDAPFNKNGYVTFGSFGSTLKITKDQISVWCEILKRLPNARFFLKAAALDEPHVADVFLSQFSKNGIDPQRVLIEGFSPHLDMLKKYGEVDIALDTYPQCAGMTTLEALWQGVPVISKTGPRYTSTHGRSILLSAGAPELVATSETEYVEKAVALANSPLRLNAYRKNLREMLARSDRANVGRYCRNLEQAYREMWSIYCSTTATSNKEERCSRTSLDKPYLADSTPQDIPAK